MKFLRVVFFIFFYIFNNMENIVEPNETFDFSKLSLAHPVGIQGGAYFTKIEYNKKPLYIQTTKGQSRQGFVKTGKKYYVDLMFDKNAETLIQWFENLENTCQKLIFNKRETWFQNGLEESDIESAFNSTIRVYKSGKFYLLRTNIKNNHNNLPTIKIYNEQEIPVNMEDVNAETNIISILEIQGIKFTTRNFQIEIELKQIMVLNNEPLFDNCLIKMDKPIKTQEPFITTTTSFNKENREETREETKKDSTQASNNEIFEDAFVNDLSNKEEILDFNIDKLNDENENQDTDTYNKNIENDYSLEKPNDSLIEKKEEIIDFDFEELEENIEENKDELNEIENLDFDLSLENKLDSSLGNEPIQLKKPNQVYFELYKEARNKAKMAKKNAIVAYLEAKNIKKTYMLESLIDSDSDFDAEIDEVSESELEGL